MMRWVNVMTKFLWIALILVAISLIIFSSDRFVEKCDIFKPDTFSFNYTELTPSQLIRIFIVSVVLFVSTLTGILLFIIFVVSLLMKRDIFPKFDILRFDVGWNVFDSFKILALSILSTIFLASLLYGLLNLNDTGWIKIGQATLFHCALLFFVIYFVVFKLGPSPGFFSPGRSGRLKKFFFSFLSYLSILPIVFIAGALGVFITRLLGWEAQPHPLASFLVCEKNVFVIIYLGIIAGIIAPISEELFFRGFLYPALRTRIGKIGAILISSLIFSLLHMEIATILPIFVLGVLFAWLYEKTADISVAIFVHSLHNSATLIGLLMVRDII
jgi:membrane protease YdiL (CAAX protease family)